MEYIIQALEKEKWQGHEIIFSDYADNCYDVDVTLENKNFSVSLNNKPLEQRRTIKYPNSLFASWLKDVQAWGVIDNNNLIAIIETASSDNNRLYISEMWVDEKHRRKGIATALLNVVKQRAIDEKRRAIFLETRSCNEHAIAFYISQGFTLIGFDSCAYSNDDIETFNVPLKFGMKLDADKV
ncbi:MAG: GNAT family N-acetyltransferase [Defluviitaleaceae bacterium]|nr:GNAT family N-acetyltransferase [Defluviitaleaceae bacterium]